MINQLKHAITKWPHAWTTLKFGSLFAGSELSQQVIIRKVWTGENERKPLDWGTVGRYAIWYFFNISTTYFIATQPDKTIFSI